MKNPEQFLSELKSAGLLRVLRDVECLPGGMARLADGRKVVNLASNNYLGLAHHPSLAEAFSRAVRDEGAGAMASRLVTGTRREHSCLEEALAALKGTEAAVSFSSGYATSLGVIASIADREDTVLMDKLSHASLIDGARLSGARLSTFLHNDMESLRKKLQHLRDANPSGGILVVTESVFSMDGDRAPLREIVRLKDEFGALLLVDEAHGFGVLGEHGAGLAEELGVSSRIDFQMGTLSKAAGVSGGYVACSRAWADVMVNSALAPDLFHGSASRFGRRRPGRGGSDPQRGGKGIAPPCFRAGKQFVRRTGDVGKASFFHFPCCGGRERCCPGCGGCPAGTGLSGSRHPLSYGSPRNGPVAHYGNGCA